MSATLSLPRPAAIDLITLLARAIAESSFGDTTLTITLDDERERATLTVGNWTPSVYVPFV